MIRVRFAPSPTGIPHIGATRTALFTYLFARHRSGEFILRIEDTDRKRIVAGSEEAIEEILKWLGLTPDKKYKQSERLVIYKEHAEVLVNENKAFEKKGAIYIQVPKAREFSWVDAVGNKKISFKGEDIENFVILKSDGFPTYHLANVVDDHLMGITHVMRGEEWTSSTPKHLYLYELFGWEIPVFAHLPVVLGVDHKKLSKRHGAKSVLTYREEGYLPEAILNFMALLGWNPGTDERSDGVRLLDRRGREKEFFSLDELIQLFDLKDINTANPIFDIRKLEWMNGVYIRKSQILNLKSKISELNPELKSIDSEVLEKFIALSQTRVVTLRDFPKLIEPFFNPQKVKLNLAQISIVRDLKEKFKRTSKWDQESIFQILKEILLKHKIKMPILYKIFTGQESGLPLPASLEILGKEITLERLT